MEGGIDWAVVAATFLGPVFAVGLTLVLQNRAQSRERKTQLLRQLLFGRFVPGDVSYSVALTLIPIEYSNHREVLRKHTVLIEALNTPQTEQNTPYRNELLVDLIFAMSKVLGYKHDQAALRQMGFISVGLVGRDELYQRSLQAQIEAADHLRRLADAASSNET